MTKKEVAKVILNNSLKKNTKTTKKKYEVQVSMPGNIIVPIKVFRDMLGYLYDFEEISDIVNRRRDRKFEKLLSTWEKIGDN